MANANITISDDDYAFELQLKEAITASLCLNPQIDEDAKTLELITQFEQENNDFQQCEAELAKSKQELKRRIHDQNFAREIQDLDEEYWRNYGNNVAKPFGERSSSSAGLGLDEPCRLYCKGLFSDEGVAGAGLKGFRIVAIGVAICDPQGSLVLNVQKPLLGDWERGWSVEELELKAELEALIEGLNVALFLDVKRIVIYCDNVPLYQYITKTWVVEQQKIATVVEQAHLLQGKFESCVPFVVARKDVKFAFKLAREVIDSQIIRSAESTHARSIKETCTICLEDIDVDQIFVVDTCLHRYCFSCMKQLVEVKLLQGMAAKCPYEGCNTVLDIGRFRKFLSSQLVDMMSRQTQEALVPVAERFYCPYSLCSVLMSINEIPVYANDVSIGANPLLTRECIKCHRPFCIDCHVPWHGNMSCDDYKKLNPPLHAEDKKLKSLATLEKWRQCPKCKNMIELSEGVVMSFAIHVELNGETRRLHVNVFSGTYAILSARTGSFRLSRPANLDVFSRDDGDSHFMDCLNLCQFLNFCNVCSDGETSWLMNRQYSSLDRLLTLQYDGTSSMREHVIKCSGKEMGSERTHSSLCYEEKRLIKGNAESANLAVNSASKKNFKKIGKKGKFPPFEPGLTSGVKNGYHQLENGEKVASDSSCFFYKKLQETGSRNYIRSVVISVEDSDRMNQEGGSRAEKWNCRRLILSKSFERMIMFLGLKTNCCKVIRRSLDAVRATIFYLPGILAQESNSLERA
ncbi:hypothetical protein GIB67_002137 [Kingdonia uniflora]|uniref:RBR-type E3 ubiquitin transferase n=1 Tax=Kingdonia uniflora TaxID=39325 RepID=A0A7J7KWK4_9MAGN|nr:hypothetical protein GIB67_002137 [Kingdonia uniflora]